MPSGPWWIPDTCYCLEWSDLRLQCVKYGFLLFLSGFRFSFLQQPFKDLSLNSIIARLCDPQASLSWCASDSFLCRSNLVSFSNL